MFYEKLSAQVPFWFLINKYFCFCAIKFPKNAFLACFDKFFRFIAMTLNDKNYFKFFSSKYFLNYGKPIFSQVHPLFCLLPSVPRRRHRRRHRLQLPWSGDGGNVGAATIPRHVRCLATRRIAASQPSQSDAGCGNGASTTARRRRREDDGAATTARRQRCVDGAARRRRGDGAR